MAGHSAYSFVAVSLILLLGRVCGNKAATYAVTKDISANQSNAISKLATGKKTLILIYING